MKIAVVVVMIAILLPSTIWAQADLADATKVKDYYSEWLASMPGVTSVDVGTSAEGTPQIQVHTDANTPRPPQLPQELNGFPIAVIAAPAESDDSTIPALAPPLVPPRR